MTLKKQSRIAAAAMLLLAIGFFVFAITHPTASFPWSNTITYTLYGVYLSVMTVLFIAPFKNRKK